ncbi:MAG: dihydrofolate reductase [Salibacteraceae bacterium]|jgi:dihydrofolate reductase
MKNHTISLIVAIAENHVIGKDNDLIWFLPKDLKYFKDTTAGHHVIMGRKNYYSIPEKFRPLPGRTNIVVTRQKDIVHEDNVIVVNSVEEAIQVAVKAGDTEPFIIGGGQIYTYCLAEELVDKMYITHVHKEYEGDTFFPHFDSSKWKKVSSKLTEADHRHETSFSYDVYEKQ